MKMALNLIFAATLFVVAAYSRWRIQRTYCIIDKLLEQALNQEEIGISTVKEGALSALVSKIRRIQEMLGKQAALAQEEKEQVKSVVSNLSHQLKTPLANLFVYVDILSGQGTSERKKEEAVEKIKKQIEKLDWLIRSLGKMVKLEQGAIQFEAKGNPIRQTVLDAVDAVFEKAEKKGLALIVEPYNDLFLYHNRKWTAEVFVNLLENAIKYTKCGGEIRIRVHPYEIYTEIQVLDNGIGIRSEELMHIDKRFYRSKEVEHIEGSGIGLYLSKLILEKEKGYFCVRSVYGEGSCFRVFLRNCP